MTKKEILDFQLPRFEQVGNEHRKQMEDGKHGGLHPTQHSQSSACEPQAISTFDAIGEAAAAIEHTETTLQMLDGQPVWQQPHENRRRPRSMPSGIPRRARLHYFLSTPILQGRV